MRENQLETEQRCTAQMQNTQPVPSQCFREKRAFCLKSFSHIRGNERKTDSKHPVGGAVDQSSAGRERER